jgi:hypothetical protein
MKEREEEGEGKKKDSFFKGTERKKKKKKVQDVSVHVTLETNPEKPKNDVILALCVSGSFNNFLF